MPTTNDIMPADAQGASIVAVLGTGGTIAGRGAAGDALTYRAGELTLDELLGKVPTPRGTALVGESLAQVDSKDMGPALWMRLADRCRHWLAQPQVKGLVVTHGSDTAEETACFLQLALAPAKPVVLACAMRPATALSPDGPQNLADAILLSAVSGLRGVFVVCAGVVHAAHDVCKVHPVRIDPFSSGDAGPVGFVHGGALQLRRDVEAPPATAGARLRREAAAWPRVEIVTSHAGADGAMVRSLLADGVGGLVVAATGNGTVHEALASALIDAQREGVRVLVSTRCTEGQVVGGSAGPLTRTGLSAVKARIWLQLSLMDETLPTPGRGVRMLAGHMPPGTPGA